MVRSGDSPVPGLVGWALWPLQERRQGLGTCRPWMGPVRRAQDTAIGLGEPDDRPQCRTQDRVPRCRAAAVAVSSPSSDSTVRLVSNRTSARARPQHQTLVIVGAATPGGADCDEGRKEGDRQARHDHERCCVEAGGDSQGHAVTAKAAPVRDRRRMTGFRGRIRTPRPLVSAICCRSSSAKW